jgi:hypothetical protein
MGTNNLKASQVLGIIYEVIMFHLLTMLHNDATETRSTFYISNTFKKPNRVPIWQFVYRIQQLNSYLDILPCIYYSDRVTKLTKVVRPFNDKNIASHILRMVPRHWQDQYELAGVTVPQSMQKLSEAYKHIEKAFLTDKEHDGSRGKASAGDCSKKKMVSFSKFIPKKC